MGVGLSGAGGYVKGLALNDDVKALYLGLRSCGDGNWN